MQSDNDNTDPFARADTALAELYRLRREVLKLDVRTMPFRRRRRDEALRGFDRVEAALLAALPPE